MCVQPNLVTYNTLIDVYGKLNKWGEAMRVLNTMRSMVSACGMVTRVWWVVGVGSEVLVAGRQGYEATWQ